MPLNAKQAKEYFHYEAASGILTWRVCLSSRAPIGSVAGSRRKDGRMQVRVNGKIYLVHRVIWLWKTGRWPVAMVDHRNLNGCDNRWENLREATDTQNKCNQRVRSNNQLGVKGVRRHWTGRYEAYITIDRKQLYLGGFADPQSASAAYAEAARKHRGEFARTA